MSERAPKAPQFQLKKHILSKKKFYYFGKLGDSSSDKKRLASADLGSSESLQKTLVKFCISKTLKPSEG